MIQELKAQLKDANHIVRVLRNELMKITSEGLGKINGMSRLRKERLLSVRLNVMKKCLEPQVLIQSLLILIPKWPTLTEGSQTVPWSVGIQPQRLYYRAIQGWLIMFITMTQILPR
ncbi:hypothetical protein AMTRI_Chr08g205890 [Amborella trichopoda]